MIRGSLVSLLVSVLLVAVDRTSAAAVAIIEVSATAPQALINTLITTQNIQLWTVQFDNVNNGRAAVATAGVVVPSNGILLHKQFPADTVSNANGSAVVLQNCQLLAGTTDLCNCTGALVNGSAATFGSGNTQISNNLYVWKAYCQLQGSVNCLNAAAVSGISNLACYVAPAPGATTQAPGGNSTSGGPAVTSIINGTTKAGASMTTSQVTVLTIGPLAMLAVANFVV